MGMNDDLGYFEFVLPKKLSFSTYAFNDVLIGDRVKVWYGYTETELTGDPDFAGRIKQCGGTNGQFALIRGQPLGEILNRRIKSRYVWNAAEADDIAATVASDLSLGATLIATDTTAVTITQDNETYSDILRKTSDYWYNAGTQVKKDYWVDVNDNLVWQARPYRTSGVSTLTYGEDYETYSYITDGTNIKNALAIYGALTPFNPSDTNVYGRKNPVGGDEWTHDNAFWTAVSGSFAASTASTKIGANYTRLSNASSPYNVESYVTLPSTVHVEGVNGYTALEFWSERNNTGLGFLRLHAPDSSNYFYVSISWSDSDDVWTFHRYSLGKNNEYNADTNPTGWQSTGSPSWEELTEIDFYCDTTGGPSYVDIDGLCLNFGRWRYAPLSDATSVSNYEENDQVIIDDNLKSDDECETRAQTILYQNKDPVARFDPVLTGNKNIKIGDRLTIDLTPENISSTYFYVTAVEHTITMDGWSTTPTLLGTINTRRVPTVTREEAVTASIKNLQQINRHQKRVN